MASRRSSRSRCRSTSGCPTPITVDIAAAVRELVALPNADLLGIEAASPLAGASCVAGKPVTTGRRTVTGVTVLDNAVDVDVFGERPIVDTQTLDLSRIADLSRVELPVIDGLLGGLPPLVLAQVTPIVLNAIRALPPIARPIDLLRVSIKPGAQTKTVDGLTQTALEVRITALGQSVVDLVLGEARVGTAGVDCAPPATAATPARKAGPTPVAHAVLACTTRRLVLTDVVRKGRRLRITGVADKRFVGRVVTVRLEADGTTAGRAIVSPDGTFATTAALPPKRLRSGNRARYQAVLGRERSLNLKLERRMYVDRLTSEDRRVTVAGRVTRPLGTPRQTITLTRRVSCTERGRRALQAADRRPVLDHRGRPEGQTAAVYRLETKVRKSQANRKLYPTFTLPRGVDLAQ